MSDYLNISDYLLAINKHSFFEGEYKEGQIGNVISVYEDQFPDVDDADIVLIGCNEWRGSGKTDQENGADKIRKQFYELHYWHHDVQLADIGNIRLGNNLADTCAALKIVISELAEINKTVVVLGGSHDLTLAQYHAYADNKKMIDAAGVDAIIDIDLDSSQRSNNFLMEMLTAEPNYLRHYNHIAFQSFFVHPRMLEAMDKLRFDCYRLGNVKEHIEDMEPVLRNCHLFTFDITAIAHAFAPGGGISPNGLTGEEASMLMQYAGMSNNVKNIGIYGYESQKDKEDLTAKQISHMLWYLLDGKSRGNKEAAMDNKESFNEYHTAFAEVETLFIQSKKTGRWWMQLPDKQFIACTYKDYLLASSNEIPERWLRAQERQ
ncbi:MAG: formimidoylglutamase [Chitinophagaceae bacterium]